MSLKTKILENSGLKRVIFCGTPGRLILFSQFGLENYYLGWLKSVGILKLSQPSIAGVGAW